ncbi:hypothetical protein F9K94_21350 [Brucella tritici]|uniref:Uncharacterized protein n=1 Tax=Brucella tritici TaxID=94626 RepID=A0A7V7VR15_9HYPH|nr:hypothetical protein [Brucella tritici]KAB2655106.1 hypothetical protein F9K94_21350 [Brucella tritici]
MARKGEPDLSMLYASVAVGGTVIASGLTNLAHGIREARWERTENRILAQNEQRLAELKTNLVQLTAQVQMFLDRLDDRRRNIYSGSTEIAAFEAQLGFEIHFETYRNVSDGFKRAELLRGLAIRIRDKIDELDDQADAEVLALLNAIDV